MRDRNDIEELMFDAKTEARNRQVELATAALEVDYRAQLSQSDLVDALAEDDESAANALHAFDNNDSAALLAAVQTAVKKLCESMAKHEIDRQIARGEL